MRDISIEYEIVDLLCKKPLTLNELTEALQKNSAVI